MKTPFWFGYVALIGFGLSIGTASAFEGPVATSATPVRYAWKACQSHDGRFVAAGFGHWKETGQVVIFESDSGEVRHRLPMDAGVRGLIAVPHRDGGADRLIAADFRGRYFEIEFATGRLVRDWEQPRGSIECLAFSHDGSKLIAGSNADFVVVWDFATAQPIGGYHGHGDNVGSVAGSPDGRWIASGDQSGDVLIVDADDYQIRHRIRHPDADDDTDRQCFIGGVLFSDDSKTLYTVGLDDHVRSWDVQTGEAIASVNGGSLHFAMTRTDDHSIAVLNRQSGLLKFDHQLNPIAVAEPGPDEDRSIDATTWGLRSVGNDQALSASWDNRVRRLDTNTGRVLQIYDGSIRVDDTRRYVGLLPGDGANVIAITAGGEAVRHDASTMNVSDRCVIGLPQSPGDSRNGSRDDSKNATAIRVTGANQWGDQCWIETPGGWCGGSIDDLMNGRTLTAVNFSSLPATRIGTQFRRIDNQIRLYAVTPDGTVHVHAGNDGRLIEKHVPDAAAKPKPGFFGLFFGEPEQVQTEGPALPFTAFHIATDGQSVRLADSDGNVYQRRFSKPGETRMMQSGVIKDSVLLPNEDVTITVRGTGYSFCLFKTEPQRMESSLIRGLVRSAIVIDDALIVATDQNVLQRYERNAPPIEPIATMRLDIGDGQVRSVCSVGDEWAVLLMDGTVMMVDRELKRVVRQNDIYDLGLSYAIYDSKSSVFWLGNFSGELVSVDPKGTQHDRHDLRRPEGGHIRRVALSPNRRRIATGQKDGHVTVIDLDSGSVVWDVVLELMPVSDLVWSPDGQALLVSYGDFENYERRGAAHLIDVGRGRSIARVSDVTRSIDAVAFAPDGRSFCVGGQDASVIAYRIETETPPDSNSSALQSPKVELIGRVLAPSTIKLMRYVDDRRCVVHCWGGGVVVVDPIGRRVTQKTVGHVRTSDDDDTPFPAYAAIDPTSDRYLTADLDGELVLWPLKSLRGQPQSLRRQPQSLRGQP